MKRVLLTGAAGDIGGRLRKLLKPIYPELRLSDIKAPAGPRTGRGVRRRRPCQAGRGREGRSTASTASSTSAASRSKGPGRRSCRPTSSAATICSRRRAARASSAWCSPRPTTPSASIRAPADRRRRHRAAGLPLRRQQGVRRGARRALRRQAWPARAVPAHRQRRRQADRPAPAVDLAEARGPRAADPHRPRASRPALRDVLRRLLQRARPGGTTAAPTTTAIARPAAPRTIREEALAAQAKLAPDPVGDFFQGGTFCSAEFDGDADALWD